MLNTQSIIIVSGATATGKTSFSINLAKQYIEQGRPCVIINFDSLLFYKELNIGTAKPTPQEMGNVPHELIGIQSAHHPMNAHKFSTLALPLIKKYQQQNTIIMLVGGSGFYLRALIKGMYTSPPISMATKQQLEQIMQQHGYDYLRLQLKKVDPESFSHIHHNDHYRTIRALEHFYEHHSPLSLEQKKFNTNEPYNFNKNPHNWTFTHYNLMVEKQEHWKIMKDRVMLMINQGLIDEVQTLLKNGFTGTEKPLQSIGYKETVEYLQQPSGSQTDLIEKIYINTRKLAKAQKTFFKKVEPKQVLQLGVNY